MVKVSIAALAAGFLLAGSVGARAAEDGQAKTTTQTQGTATETPKGSTEHTDINKGAGSGMGTVPPAGNSGETEK